MKKLLSLLLISTSSLATTLAQTPRKPINISNDFYTIKIEDGVEGEANIKGGLTERTTFSVTKEKDKFLKMENTPLKMILKKVFPNKKFSIKTPALSDKIISIELTYPGITQEEASGLFWQQMVQYFSLKVKDNRALEEKWTLTLQDSLKLNQQVHGAKDITEGYVAIEMDDSQGDWSIEKSTLDEFVKRLSKKIELAIENTIVSQKKYHFDFILKQPIDYEVVKKKLQDYGIGIIAEKTENKVVEID